MKKKVKVKKNIRMINIWKHLQGYIWTFKHDLSFCQPYTFAASLLKGVTEQENLSSVESHKKNAQ